LLFQPGRFRQLAIWLEGLAEGADGAGWFDIIVMPKMTKTMPKMTINELLEDSLPISRTS
jgi:hypothetical protein